MKKMIFLSLLVLSACGKVKLEDSNPQNDESGYFPLAVEGEELRKITLVCDSLKYKERRMSTGIDFTFGQSQKGCKQDKFPTLTDMAVTTMQPNGEYIFMPSNGIGSVLFPDVETSNKGVMAKVCDEIDRLMTPMQLSSDLVLNINTNDTKYCNDDDGNHVCINLDRGPFVSGTAYKILTREFIKFKISGGNQGYFVERRSIADANCAPGEKLEKWAVMRNP